MMPAWNLKVRHVVGAKAVSQQTAKTEQRNEAKRAYSCRIHNKHTETRWQEPRHRDRRVWQGKVHVPLLDLSAAPRDGSARR